MIKNKKPEVLAPAGSMESIYAAVRCGADGIYVGGKNFSARANAVNFSQEELKEAADYCHLHGVKLYRAMNVVIFDSEIQEFYDQVRLSAEAGIDGLIIQDLGAAYIAALAVPDMPLHASTQMTVHTPMGAEAAADMGFVRVVPARELSLENIKSICDTGVETEVFVHGAQCMSVSGQCYMSAVIGSRSANRGQCAQACRLPFCANGKNEESFALSLKDMSLVEHTAELIEAGAASFKIEGRMKRPEYVAAAVTAMRNAVDGKNCAEDMERLEAVFSRSGFTDGYLTQRLGNGMFGHRRREDVVSANSVLPELAALYRNESKGAVIDFSFSAHMGEPCCLEFKCGYVTGRVTGNIPEAARNRSLAHADVEKQLVKLGDTIYSPGKLESDIEPGIMLPASEINRMRREAVHMADEMIIRSNTPSYTISDSHPERLTAYVRSAALKLRIQSDSIKNISDEAIKNAELIMLPIHVCGEISDREIMGRTAVILPGFVTDENRLSSKLKELQDKGFVHFMCGNFTHMGVLKKMDGIIIHGGTGMNITNSYALKAAADMGFADAVLSFEMNARQISYVKKAIPSGIAAYGRIPLMTVRNCPVKAQSGCGKCRSGEVSGLTDRTGRFFPVKCDPEGYSVIYNCDVLETSDKLSDFSGISFAVIDVSGLDINEADRTIKRYMDKQRPQGNFTRGLYYRGVL